MSNKLCGQVWDLALPRSERDVLMAMADNADDDGSRCYPSIDHLAWKTDYSPRQVQRAIASLKAKGIVEVEANAEGGRGRLPEYRLYLGRAERKRSWEAVKGDILSRRAPERVTSAHVKGDISGTERVTPATTKGDIRGIPSIYEPVLNPTTEPLRKKEGARPTPSPSPVIDPDDEMAAAMLAGCCLDPELTRPGVLLSVADYAKRLKARKFTPDEVREAAATWHEFLPHLDPEDVEPPHPQQLLEWVGRRRAAKAQRKAAGSRSESKAAAVADWRVPYIER